MTQPVVRENLSIVIVGHVDHGKSTLVGRLFHDTGSLPDGKFEQIKAVCERRGMPFEWAFLMDALQAERDQGITIDTTRIFFKTAKRDYTIIDAPGHKEFLKNMITGAASAEAALLLIDAQEGVQEQSRRHGYLLHLLGVKQIAVVVNKMDLVDYDADQFGKLVTEYTDYLAKLGVEPLCFVPVSAREGDNIATRSRNMPWYQGPTVVGALDQFTTDPGLAELPLRLPLQGVYKFDNRRILAGRIESGTLTVGDELLFSPVNKTAKVRSIETWNAPEPLTQAYAGMSVGITLDEQIFVERGHVASHVEDGPIETTVFKARLFWLGRKPLEVGNSYTLKLGTTECPVTVETIEHVVDTQDLASGSAVAVERNAVAEVVLRTRQMLCLDEHSDNPLTGRFVLVEDYVPVGGGLISMEGYPDQRDLITMRGTNLTAVEHKVSHDMRVARNGHSGCVLWFTGLSGSGKSTLALALEQHLFAKGYQVYVLDGDNIRHGLNSNLSFSPEDRAENIRRVGEVAALFADAGFIVVTSFISPYRSDRDRAREAALKLGVAFHEIFIDADLEVCEARDPKGLYKKARAGEIKEFTGISAPYEEPLEPSLRVDNGRLSPDAALAEIVDFTQTMFRSSSNGGR